MDRVRAVPACQTWSGDREVGTEARVAVRPCVCDPIVCSHEASNH